MLQEEALAIASQHGKTSQVAFFMIFLGFPPREALTRVGINLQYFILL